MGQFITQTVYKGRTSTFRLYVIRGENVNKLLSRPASLATGLIKPVYEIRTSEQEFGPLKTQPVKMTLQDNTQPYAVATVR